MTECLSRSRCLGNRLRRPSAPFRRDPPIVTTCLSNGCENEQRSRCKNKVFFCCRTISIALVCFSFSFFRFRFLCSISICVKKRTRLLLGRLTSSRLLGSCKSFNPKLYTESLRTKTLAHGDVCEVFQSWPVLPHMWELDFVERGLKKSENQATNQRSEQKNKVCKIKKTTKGAKWAGKSSC